MIEKISIENYKSLQSLQMDLGRVNVLIGANGCGKTNILEAIAIGGAVAPDILKSEFIVNRGVRWTDFKAMISRFDKNDQKLEIIISVKETGKEEETFIIRPHKKTSNQGYSKDLIGSPKSALKVIRELIQKQIEKNNNAIPKNDYDFLENNMQHLIAETYAALLNSSLSSFLIYCPENTALRNFESEGQIEPLGIKGEGLFKHLVYLAKEKRELFEVVRQQLQLIDWYDDFEIPQDLHFTEKRLSIKDRYLDDDLAFFDQRSANEGFLYLLFYLVLFVSPETPSFFAIDNVDNSLNPKLCSKLMSLIAELAKTYNKQVILTAHNPAVLDGLNLGDDEQRLFVISRNAYGHTKAHRVLKKAVPEGSEPIPLSERFLRGYIGGLPKNF